MKFTDLFVKRPVLAIVVNLVILIAGCRRFARLSVRQYPRSDIAVSSKFRPLCRRERRSRPRLYHYADRARHRERGRHRLHGIDAVPGTQHDPGSPEDRLRHDRGPHSDPGQSGAGSQRPSPGRADPSNRSADCRHTICRGLSGSFFRRSRSEPDYRLPDSGRAAQAERGRVCSVPIFSAIVHSRCAFGSSRRRWPRVALLLLTCMTRWRRASRCPLFAVPRVRMAS